MKSQNPWMGRAKGSAGGMTASKVYDKNVLKAKAFEVNNPNTAAQQNQRTFFKEISDLVNQLTEEQCRFICPKAPKGMSRRNFLSKQLASYVTTSSGQKVVDLANIKTLGNAKEVDFLETQMSKDGTELMVNLPGDTPGEKYDESHQLVVMLISLQNKEIKLGLADALLSDSTNVIFEVETEATIDDFNAIAFSVLTDETLYDFGTKAVSERPAR